MPKPSEREQIEAVLLQHLPDMVTLCNRMFARREDAEDAVQQSVIKMIGAWDDYRGEGPIKHWILKIVLNTARNHSRSLSLLAQREKTMNEERAMNDAGINRVQQREVNEQLRTAITQLPPEVAECVTLYYFNRLSQQEIAGFQGCSQKTVNERLEKGREQLNRKMAATMAGMVPVVALLQGATLDAVPATLTAGVKGTVAAVLAASTTTAGAGAAGAAVATGGAIMKAKMIIGAAAIALTCFFTGTVVSTGLLSDPLKNEEQSNGAGEAQVRGHALYRAQQKELDQANAGKEALSARVDALNAELKEKEGALNVMSGEMDSLRAQLREQQAKLDELLGGKTEAVSWDKIQPIISGVLDVLRKLEAIDWENSPDYSIGMTLVTELGKLSKQDWEMIMEYNGMTTNPDELIAIAGVMTNGLTFAKKDTGHMVQSYMESYLNNLKSGAFGDEYAQYALFTISWSNPPYADAFASTIQPLNAETQKAFVDYAVNETLSTSETRRWAGVEFLSHSDGPEAQAALTRVVSQETNAGMRGVAIRGLANHGDMQALEFLRSAVNTEADETIKQQMESTIASMEKRLVKNQ